MSDHREQSSSGEDVSRLSLAPAASFKSLPTAQPAYVLRGHAAAIHSVEFIRSNSGLITGDADGWVILWDVATRRPTAVWRAHESAILRTAAWEHDQIITHGRDHKLLVWKLAPSDESALSRILPADTQQCYRQQPWLLHALDVNTLNFCSFAMCEHEHTSLDADQRNTSSIFDVAVPSALDSEGIDIFQLPSESRIHAIPADSSIKTGMVMALGMCFMKNSLYVATGYESGHSKVYHHDTTDDEWKQIYVHQAHSQPVLSLSILPSREHFFTSSADAILAKHPLSTNNHTRDELAPTTINTRHSGQQGLNIRSDGKIFATAGWDSRVRVYSTSTMTELAVLKWHQDGCYATAFAETGGGDVHLHQLAAIGDDESGPEHPEQALVQNHPDRRSRMLSGERRRTEKARSTHWLAAGSKDGKISLWDIY